MAKRSAQSAQQTSEFFFFKTSEFYCVKEKFLDKIINSTLQVTEKKEDHMLNFDIISMNNIHN